jgi:hypothetical protein
MSARDENCRCNQPLTVPNVIMVVYHLHGKPIRFEIVLMVSKISDRKSHSDYALSIYSDWPEGTEGLFTFTWKTHPVRIKSRRAWNWWKNKKDVNGTKFTGWNVPIGKRGQPFQTNRLFRKISGLAVKICLFHLFSVWNHRNFHVNGKQP